MLSVEKMKQYAQEYKDKKDLKEKYSKKSYKHKYYEEHREEILFKQRNRYRIKCGLPPLKK